MNLANNSSSQLSVLDIFANRLDSLDIKKDTINDWLNKYGVSYLDEKINLMEGRDKTTWKAEDFLVKAIHHNWTGKATEQIGKTIFPSHQENVSWYKSLSEGEKQIQYHKALYKQDIFELHLAIKNISFLDADFHESTYFKYMMSLLGRFP